MKYFFIPIYLLALNSTAIANTDGDYGVTVEAGAVHNSELVVEEIDQRSASGDLARYLSLDLNGELTFHDQFKVEAGFNISDTDYQDSNDFDLTIKRLYGSASYEISDFTIGVNQHQITADLAGNEFIDIDRSSVYLSKLFDDNVFIRTAFTTSDKIFNDIPQRNASNDTLGVDTYFFFNQAKSFFLIGASTEDEQASSNEYSYDGNIYRATFSNKFGDSNKHRLQLKLRYFDRNYEGSLPELASPRKDTRHVMTFAWDYYFTPEFALATQLEKTESESNFEPADYSSNEIQVLLKIDL